MAHHDPDIPDSLIDEAMTEALDMGRRQYIAHLAVVDDAIPTSTIHSRVIAAAAHYAVSLLEAHDAGVHSTEIAALRARGYAMASVGYRADAQAAVLANRQAVALSADDADYSAAQIDAAAEIAAHALGRLRGGQ